MSWNPGVLSLAKPVIACDVKMPGEGTWKTKESDDGQDKMEAEGGLEGQACKGKIRPKGNTRSRQRERRGGGSGEKGGQKKEG